MRTNALRCGVLWLLLCWPGAAWGQRPGDPVITRDKEPSGDVAYEGTLICYRCDVTAEAGRRGRCERDGHLPLLKRKEGHTYRLYGNTHAIGAQLTSDKLHGGRVHVEGVYEPATNWLRVREVYLVGEKPNPFGFDGENR